MSFTTTPADQAPITGLKIVRLDGETILAEMDISLTPDGLLIGEIDGQTFLLGVPINYDRAAGNVAFAFNSDTSNITYWFSAPNADKGLVWRFLDGVNTILQFVFHSRNGANVDVINLQIVSTSGSAVNAMTIQRSTGRISIPNVFRFNPLSTPSSPLNGMIYYDSSTHKFRGYANGAWVDLH